MRDRVLHGRLREFAEEAAFALCVDHQEAADLPFEVVAAPGARGALYCYRPLTDDFIRERAAALARLPTHATAAAALGGLAGIDDYLRLRGLRPPDAGSAQRAREVLQALLGVMYAERTDFTFDPERFERAYEELEAAVYVSRSLTTVIAPVHGLRLDSDTVPIDDGLALTSAAAVDAAPPEAVWSAGGEHPRVLAVVTLEGDRGAADVAETAAWRLRRLLTALRLADAGSFGLGAAAWARVDAGPWQLIELDLQTGGPPAGESHHLRPEEEDELRGFCNLIARRVEARPRGEVGWALARFEAGCARRDRRQALSDHLLALRALLEPEGPGRGRLAQRLAAICAPPAQRAGLAQRAAHAVSLERAVIAGLPPAAPDADALIDDIAHHLRSLLRDVLCGHLDADLVKLADDLLADAVTGEHEAVPEARQPALITGTS